MHQIAFTNLFLTHFHVNFYHFYDNNYPYFNIND
jgi:hypothetical protein